MLSAIEVKKVMQKAQVLAFDLDGTLLNTVDDLAISCNAALEAKGYPVRELEEVRTFIGNGIPKLLERALPEGEAVAEAEFGELLNLLFDYYQKHLWDNTVPYEGIVDVLAKLKAEGKILLVLTNKNEEMAKQLVAHFFPDTFVRVLGETPEEELKPNPAYFLKTVSALELENKELVLFGDSDTDMKTAKNSKIPGFGVSWGYRGREVLAGAGADYIFTSPGEILQLL